MLTLLKDVKANEIPAKYVLLDTWFCSPSSLLYLIEDLFQMCEVLGYNTLK